MATLSGNTPTADQDHGPILISIVVENGLGQITRTLLVNGVDKSSLLTAEVDGAFITYTAQISFLGPQEVFVVFRFEDDNGTVQTAWSFTVLSERVIGTSDAYYEFSPYLDVLSSYFPSYSRAVGRDSVFRQLMNPFAEGMDNIKEALNEQSKGIYIDTAYVLDPDWVSVCELDEDQNFSVKFDAAGNLSVSYPEIKGILDHNKISLIAKPTFDQFWVHALPTRFDIVPVASNMLGALTSSEALHAIADLPAFDNPSNGRLWFDVHSGSSLVSLNGDELQTTRVLISGYGFSNKKQTESLAILENGVVSTQKTWTRVESISLEACPDNMSGEIVVYSMPPRNCSKTDGLYRSIKDRVPDSIKWTVSSDEASSYIIRQVAGRSHLLDIASGESTFNASNTVSLKDSGGNDVLIQDFSIDPFRKYLWGIVDKTLYVWSRHNRAPEVLKELAGSTETPEIAFEAVAYEPPYFDSGAKLRVSVELERPRSVKTVDSWSWSILKPDGTTVYLDLNKNIITTAPVWQSNPQPISSFGIKDRNFSLILDTVGDYVFILSVRFKDRTTETVKRIVQFDFKTPICEYPLLLSEVITNQVSRVHISENGRFYVAIDEACYELIPRYDYYCLDIENKKIIFRENYDSVEVKL